MSNINFKLNKKDFRFVVTDKGRSLLGQLSVDMKAVRFGNKEALRKYAYCMCAGATLTEKKKFPFTLEQFIKACPKNWKEQTIFLLNSVVKNQTKTGKK